MGDHTRSEPRDWVLAARKSARASPASWRSLEVWFKSARSRSHSSSAVWRSSKTEACMRIPTTKGGCSGWRCWRGGRSVCWSGSRRRSGRRSGRFCGAMCRHPSSRAVNSWTVRPASRMRPRRRPRSSSRRSGMVRLKGTPGLTRSLWLPRRRLKMQPACSSARRALRPLWKVRLPSRSAHIE